MVRIHQKMNDEKYKSKMILQVHDELIFEVVPGELEKLREMVVYEMTNAVKIDIPLKVDYGTGKNWLEAH
jgi:DNA polymerase-1